MGDEEEGDDLLVGLLDLAFVVVLAQLGPHRVEEGFLALLDGVLFELLECMVVRSHTALLAMWGSRSSSEVTEAMCRMTSAVLNFK